MQNLNVLRLKRVSSVKPFTAFRRSSHKQSGATLIVALVLLAVVTVIGIASIRSSNLQLKMSASARDRAVAFQVAESALRQVERTIFKEPYTMDDFMPTCSWGGNARCFKPYVANDANQNTSCATSGLCFSGDLEGAITRSDCRLARYDGATGTYTVEQPWQQSSYWAQNSVQKVEVVVNGEGNNFETVEVPYMIEFMCFVPRDDRFPDDENNRNGGLPLYRISVHATGTAKRSKVMLQSLVKAAQ